MVLLSILKLQKAAKKAAEGNKAKENKVQQKKTQTTTSVKPTQEQKETAKNLVNNIKNEWLIKWTQTTAKQNAQKKSEANLKSKYSDIYKQMWNEWFSETEITQALKKRQAQEQATQQMMQNINVPSGMVDWTEKQQNAYKQLVSEWYSEADAKQAIMNYRKSIDDSMTTWEKWKTRWKAFLQWIADVWQRQIWRPIDWVTWKIENKLDQRYENSEWFQNFVNKAWKGIANAMWATDEDIRAFQQSEAERKAKWIPSTYWSILTDQEENSGIWQRWRKWWQYWALAAESIAMWWIASWWAKAAGTAAWSKLVWWLAGTVLWAWEWAIWADAFARWLEDRAATKNERITWAALWWVFGGISWYRQTAKALAQNKELAWLVQDTSKAWKTKAAEEWRIIQKKSLTKTETIQELSQKEKDAVKLIQKEWLWNANNPDKLVKNIQNNISKTASEMSDDMKNINVTKRWKQELKQNLREIIKNPEDWTSKNKSTINKLIKQADKATNVDDLWKIRKDYDKLFTAWQKAWYGKGWTTETMYNLWQDWRRILNTAINNSAENAWNASVKAWMQKLSTLITAEDNITQNLVKQVWKDQLTTLWKLLQWWKKAGKKALTYWWFGLAGYGWAKMANWWDSDGNE